MMALSDRSRWNCDHRQPGKQHNLSTHLVALQARAMWLSPSADPRVSALLECSAADLSALRMSDPVKPDDSYLGASAPWYFTLFGARQPVVDHADKAVSRLQNSGATAMRLAHLQPVT